MVIQRPEARGDDSLPRDQADASFERLERLMLGREEAS